MYVFSSIYRLGLTHLISMTKLVKSQHILKAHVSEEILKWPSLSCSLSADLCIHFYCLSQLKQARQRKIIHSSALILRL